MEKIIKTFNSILFILFIILSFKIINIDYYVDISNKEYFNNLFNLTFNYNKLFNINNHTTNVSNEIKYIKNNEKYITNSNYIYSLKEGIIYIDNYKIKIFQIDDFILIFEGEFNTILFNGDYIENGSLIGEYFEPFSLYLIKDNIYYSYEDYIRNYI